MEQIFENFNLEKELANRGRKVCGNIPLAVKADGSYVNIPVMMAIGVEPGPVIVTEACTHGDEVEGAEGIQLTFERLDVSQMKGAFIGIPVLNMAAFSDVSRYSCMDFVPQDMNRIFPGNAGGSITQRITAYYFDNFVKNADAVVAFHGGGNNLALTPVTLFQNYGDKISETSADMAKAMGFEGLWQNNICSEKNGILDELAYLHGVPAVTAEIGGQASRLKYRATDPERIAKGFLNILRYWKVLDGPVETFANQFTIEMEYITNCSGGINKPLKKCGERVKKGEALSQIVNVFGAEQEVVTAPFDGIVMGVWVTPVCQPGGWVYMLGRFVDEKNDGGAECR